MNLLFWVKQEVLEVHELTWIFCKKYEFRIHFICYYLYIYTCIGGILISPKKVHLMDM